MSTTSKPTAKLKLRTETLRKLATLSDDQLANVAGGLRIIPSANTDAEPYAAGTFTRFCCR